MTLSKKDYIHLSNIVVKTTLETHLTTHQTKMLTVMLKDFCQQDNPKFDPYLFDAYIKLHLPEEKI